MRTTINIHAPTFHKYSELYQIYSQTLTCSCTTISIDYKTFLHIEYKFHQICNSIYVTDDWISYIAPSFEHQPYHPPSFIWTGTNTFQTLSAFCKLTNRTISQTLSQFYSNQYISPTITPMYLFESRVQSLIDEFISLTTYHFLLSLEIIRDTTHANSLLSAKQTNVLLHFERGYPFIDEIPLAYSNCQCYYSSACIQEANIYSYSNLTILFSVPGHYVGCLPFESVLQSTLQCYYDQQCVDRLRSYFSRNSLINNTALDSKLPSRFLENSTVRELVDQLMVESWNRSITYENYYNACKPISCIYNYKKKNAIAYILITLFSLSGGIITMLKIIIPLLVKLGRVNRQVHIEQTEIIVGQENRSWLSQLKDNLLTFNLFQSIPPSTNEFELQNERISTVLFIVFFSLFLAIILVYSSLKTVINIVHIPTPTLENYSKLYIEHAQTLKCPCTTLSINYEKFLSVEYTFHQVCTSVYISNDWIQYIDGRSVPEIIGLDDFRWIGMNTFRALRSMCQLANKTVRESLNRFYSNQYISSTITPLHLFTLEIQSLFEQSISSVISDIISSLQLIRDTTQVNGLWSITGMQYILRIESETDILSLVLRKYPRCSCDDSPTCILQSYIYRFSDRNTLFSIPGIYFGCLAIEALFQSTLECFYNQTCINKLQSFYTFKEFMNVSALDSKLLTRFSIYSTIQEIFNKLMIEVWNQTIIYENYYHACQPKYCIYRYSTRKNTINMLITIFGLSGGLITMLKIILPLLVKLVRKNERLPITIPENVLDQPQETLFQRSIKFCRTCNFFSMIPPSNNNVNIHNERMSTRLFILFVLLSTFTIIIYTSLIEIRKTVNIQAPTFQKYSKLYTAYPDTLTCPCKIISIDYKEFLHVEYTFHQLCSSIFVTDVWSKHISQSLPNMKSAFRNFRGTSKYLFETFNVFCELSKKAIYESLMHLYSNQYITKTVISSKLLHLQAQLSFDQFISLAKNDLLLLLDITREITQANGFFSARWTNYDLHPTHSPTLYGMEILTQNPQYYSNCRCDISMSCVEQSAIYDTSGITKLFTIPGVYEGCFIIESSLLSTLECFYNQTCINHLNVYLLSNSTVQIKALDRSLPSRFFQNSTLQELLNELMIEKWNLSVVYEKYYNACQPIHCTYSYVTRYDIIYMITIILGLIGGITTTLRVIIPQLVQLLGYFRRHRVVPDPSHIST